MMLTVRYYGDPIPETFLLAHREDGVLTLRSARWIPRSVVRSVGYGRVSSGSSRCRVERSRETANRSPTLVAAVVGQGALLAEIRQCRGS